MAKFRKKNGGPSAEPAAPPQSESDVTTGVQRERIEARAYELYLQRGGGDGAAMDDWLAAEREMREHPGSDDEQS